MQKSTGPVCSTCTGNGECVECYASGQNTHLNTPD